MEGMEQGSEKIRRSTSDLVEEFKLLVNEDGHVDFGLRPGDPREPASEDFEKRQLIALFNEVTKREDLSEEDQEDIISRFDGAKRYLGLDDGDLKRAA